MEHEDVVKTPEQLALALRANRKKAGLTQQAVAKKVGMLPKTISALETKPQTSSIESLFRQLSALNLQLIIRRKGTNKLNKAPEW